MFPVYTFHYINYYVGLITFPLPDYTILPTGKQSACYNVALLRKVNVHISLNKASYNLGLPSLSIYRTLIFYI